MNTIKIMYQAVFITMVIAAWMATVGCTYNYESNPEESESEGGEDVMPRKNPQGEWLTRSLSTNMTTTTNPLGSFFNGQGSTLQSINIDNLEPGEYTIQFEVQPPSDQDGFAAYAIVNWIVDGQQLKRIISIYQGASISGVAEAVNVQLVDQSGDNVTVPPRAAAYKINVTLAKGTRGNVQQPPVLYTLTSFLVAPASSSADIPIPTDAGVISIYASAVSNDPGPLAPTDVFITELGTSGGLGAFYPNVSVGWNPLAPGSTEIQVTNTDATRRAAITIIWGVEG